MFEIQPDGRYFIPKMEFYITNVCNLTCDNCNRFNNHDFKGWQRWSDYEAVYEAWGKRINIGKVVILGGEPLLNPTLRDWVLGINRIWNRPVQILTNATRLNHTPHLYDLLRGKDSSYPVVQRLQKTTNTSNYVGVSWHNADNTAEIDQLIRRFLKGNVELNKPRHIEKFGNAFRVWNDENGVAIPIWMQDEFETASLIPTPGGFGLHDTPIDQAHSACTFVNNKNYHFIRGALYKCGPVALLPEFDQQHPLLISDQDRELLNSYRPLRVENWDTDAQEFLQNLDNPIPQCKFCPAQKETKKITAVTKNKRVIPINIETT